MRRYCHGKGLYPASVKTTSGLKWGYINQKGQLEIGPQFDEGLPFQENHLAIVRMHDKYGVINETGLYVVKPIYRSILPYSEGLAVVTEEEQGMMVIDEAGKCVTQQAFSFIHSFQEGLAIFQDKTNGLYGYMNNKGIIVIEALYKNINDFRSGKALVQLRNGHHALINQEGEELQCFPFHVMGIQGEGLFAFKKTIEDGAGYVNEEGIITVPAKFSSAMPFENGRAIISVRDHNGEHFGLIDKRGNTIIPPIYHDLNQLGQNRVAVGKAINWLHGMLGPVYAIADSASGEIMTDFIYDYVEEFQDGYSSVTKGLYSFLIKTNGVPAVNFPIIEGIGSLRIEGEIIRALIDGKISYYDQNCRLLWG